MKLSTESVHSARALATWLVRAAAVILVGVGSYLFLKRLVFGLMVSDMKQAFGVWMEIGEGHSAARGLAMVAVGAALGLLSRRIVRWAIVPAASGCAGCGYPHPESGVCPECGMRQD